MGVDPDVVEVDDLDDLSITRRLARDQWVRLHGTPRITVLAGSSRARTLWHAWLGLGAMTGLLAEGADVGEAVSHALHHALAHPHDPVAVIAPLATWTAWRAHRIDRGAAMVAEGWLPVPERVERPERAELRPGVDATAAAQHDLAPTSSADARSPTACDQSRTEPHPPVDARSAAEAALFDALEATPATTGRFALNESLSVRFGSRAAEVDLLSRVDAIAIEVDGIHHFADPDCYRRDRRKDVLMQIQGYLVIRVLAEDILRDPREAVNQVVMALTFRRQGTPR